MVTQEKLRLLLVDDSALVRSILKQVFSDDPEISVVGEASNGLAGCEENLRLKPDAIIMDLEMPVMDGISATGRIMQEQPVPVIIFSSAVNAASSFDAVAAGAVDIIPKPDMDEIGSPKFIQSFKEKVNAARKTHSKAVGGKAAALKMTSQAVLPEVEAVVIGASTGGPQAVRTLLSALPAGFPVGIAIVQHLETGFDRGYAAWLNDSSRLKVRLAENNDRFTPGEVLVSPVDIHLAVRNGRLQLEDTPRVENQKPAVDVLFSTASEYYRDRLLAVLLTGMGRDGASGCKKIIDSGGYTLVQDKESSAIYGMPRAAAEIGGASEIQSLSLMAERLCSLLGVSPNS